MQNLKKALTMAITGIALFPLTNHAQPLFTNLITTLTMTFEQAQNLATPVLPLGGSYFFRATGRYGVGPGDRGEAMHDAAWATVITSTLDETHNPNYGWQWNGTSTNRPSPDVYQSNHVYNFYFVGRSAAEVLTFTDTVYGDNVGTLTFQLYEITQDPFKNGLVAYYPFNGNANDQSGNGHNPTVNTATFSTDRFGTSNRACSFDGSNEIQIPLNSDFNAMTFSAWVLMNVAYAPGQPQHGLFDGRHSFSDNLVFANIDTELTQAFFGGVGFNPHLAVNHWYHFLAVHNNFQQLTAIYLDGKAIYSATNITAAPLGFVASAYLGRSYDTPHTDRLNGNLDDVRIYNRALSPSEVQQLYEYESGPRVNLIKAVKPSFSNLTLMTNYQLQVSGDLNNWTNQGSAFTATNTSMVYPQYFDLDNSRQLFFRLQSVP